MSRDPNPSAALLNDYELVSTLRRPVLVQGGLSLLSAAILRVKDCDLAYEIARYKCIL